MAKLPYFPFFPADWLSSPTIQCATLEEQGAYVRILCACWLSNDCTVKDDSSTLSKLSGLPEHSLTFVRSVLVQHPSIEGHLTNKRLLDEFKKAQRFIAQKVQAGKKSGKSRRTSVRSNSTNETGTSVRNHIHNSSSSSSSEVISQKHIQIEEKNKKILSASTSVERHQAKTVEVWRDFRAAYHDRYHVDPVRNMQVNAMLSKLVDRLGKDDAPHVAAFYLRHNNPYYVQKRHPVNLLLQDAEGLRTQWATGVKATTGEARNLETMDNMQGQHDRVMKLLNQGGVT